jgi:large repetitive protein
VIRVPSGVLAPAAALTAVAMVAGTTFSAFSGSTSSAGNTFVAAASFGGCTSPGIVTAQANADAWVDQNSPGSNFGGDQILKLHKQSGRAARALVRFALPAVPSGCSVTAASLRLFAASSNGSETVRAVRIGGSWTENGVRWTNQPAPAGAAAATTGVAGWNQWGVTAQVQAMYAGANNGFLVRYQNEGSPAREMQLHARDKGSEHPELRITFG